ncbi:BTB/POZ domain-containing protein [Phanerochaete sordida]|uniref:BTB/POZ domain-containing protein n=1 Tax=Phanerochaete sordida TaxID=48140 RepID=A0A9P3LC51_9APHY|nr:BTB/POZ domain-containing protein [Phanerochaete sordida]
MTEASPTASEGFLPAPADNAVQPIPLTNSHDEPTERRHPKYYFDDGTVLLLVGGVSYRIHRYLLSRDSPVWATILASGSPADELNLADKSTLDFDAFLDVLYSTYYRAPTLTTTSEWSAVLRLATEWSFEDVRTLAIENLTPIASPVEKLVLSYSHAIPEWRPSAYTALCTRDRTLTAAEIAAIQAEDVAVIMSVREVLLREGAQLGTSDVSARVAVVLHAEMQPDTSALETNASPYAEPAIVAMRAEGPAVFGSATPDGTTPSLSSPTSASVDSTPSVPAPPPSSDYRADIAGLFDVIGKDTLQEVATEIIRGINCGDNAHGFAILEYTISLIYEKTVAASHYSPDRSLWIDLYELIVRGLPSEASAFTSGEAQNDEDLPRSARKCIVDRLLAQIESVKSMSEDTSSKGVQGDNLTAYVFATLGFKELLTVADVHEVLESSMALAEDYQRNGRQMQLFCRLLTAAAPQLRRSLIRVDRADTRKRMNCYMSGVQMARDIISIYDQEGRSWINNALQMMSGLGWH